MPLMVYHIKDIKYRPIDENIHICYSFLQPLKYSFVTV